jgi:hypothetical protein
VENAADSGCSMDSCYGLSIHEKDETWRTYTTIWEDAVARAAQVELSEIARPKDGKESLRIHKKLEELHRELGIGEETVSKASETAAEAAAEEKMASPLPAKTEENASAGEEALQEELAAETIPEEVKPDGTPSDGMLSDGGQADGMPSDKTPPDEGSAEGTLPGGTLPDGTLSGGNSSDETPSEKVPQLEEPPEKASSPETEKEEEPPVIPGDPKELERLEKEEQQNNSPQALWDSFRKRYPKISAFDSPGSCEILTIRPQDIGLLPRETWSYGNNSFLLHGYYNYRYLILARIGGEGRGRVRYILGVPGHYYSNEKYMASMFGFPHFVLSKKQPSQDGRFGYWYTDIRMENRDV